MDDKNQKSKEQPYVRRTVSISPKINKSIQELRAAFMRQNPVDEYDYTSVANALMAWGIVFISTYDSTEKDEKLFHDLIGDRFQLGEYGIQDAWDTIHAGNTSKTNQKNQK